MLGIFYPTIDEFKKEKKRKEGSGSS